MKRATNRAIHRRTDRTTDRARPRDEPGRQRAEGPGVTGAQRLGQAGFSLVEALIGAGLLLIVAIGILPLFTRALIDNNAGSEYTQVSNHGKSRVEEVFQMGFNSAGLMTIDAGQQVSEQVDHYRADTESWVLDKPVPATPPKDPDNPLRNLVPWERTTTVRQYSVEAISDLEAPGLDLQHGAALSGDTDPIFVHLKEVQVVVESTRTGGPLGGGKQVLLRTFKSR